MKSILSLFLLLSFSSSYSTSLGTPLTKSAKKVLLLGSGELGKELTIELQRLGVEVIACDKYENAPAMQVAHKSEVFSMLDGQKLRALVEKKNQTLLFQKLNLLQQTHSLNLNKKGIKLSQQHKQH